MKCPRCGNEISSEEAFCGQCGTPNTALQALQTEIVHTPPPNNRPLNPYANNRNGVTPNIYGTTPLDNRQGEASFPASSLPPQSMPPINSSQQTGFYREATEAMSVLPSNPNVGYPPQQPYPMTPPSGAYPPQGTHYGFQSQPPQVPPLQTGNYARQAYPQQPIQGEQLYRGVPTSPPKQKNGVITFIVSICLVVALLSIVGVGTLYVLKSHNSQLKNAQTPGIAPTATMVPTTLPTPTDTVAPTATIAPTLTPTTVPTAAPVAGFAYCGQLCTTNGFSTQYPMGWSATPLTTAQGVQFLNPATSDQTATFKTLGATTSSPNDLVANDLQQNFAAKPGYTVVTPTSTASIGGETWFEEVITYQGTSSQIEQDEVYANVHQGKAYILELQATQAQFATVTTPNFITIKNQFQFL